MKKKSLFAITFVFILGFLVGSYTPTKVGSAASNVVLASVEWVTNQMKPLQTRVTKLEGEVSALRQALEDGGTVITLPSKVYVSSLSATVHKGASRDYAVVANFGKGKELPVKAEHVSTDGKWYRIEYVSGNYGWIYSGDVSTSPVAKPTSVLITTTTSVHSGATTNYRAVATLPKGTSVKYIGSYTNNKNELWLNVELSNGVRGWIQSIHGEVK
jgi:uncharacterized protein YgiM (DUF1202 family)